MEEFRPTSRDFNMTLKRPTTQAKLANTILIKNMLLKNSVSRSGQLMNMLAEEIKEDIDIHNHERHLSPSKTKSFPKVRSHRRLLSMHSHYKQNYYEVPPKPRQLIYSKSQTQLKAK